MTEMKLVKVDKVDESVKQFKSSVLIKIVVGKRYKQLRCADLTRGLTVSAGLRLVKCEGARGFSVYILIMLSLNHRAFIFNKKKKVRKPRSTHADTRTQICVCDQEANEKAARG